MEFSVFLLGVSHPFRKSKILFFILNYHVLFQFINIFDIILHISLTFGKRGENITRDFIFFGTNSCYSFLVAKSWRKKWKQKNRK